MQPRALVPVRDVGEPVGRLEGELAEDLHHAIPRYLWVCRLSRHCGWARQYSTASRVFFSRSGPSIGCSSRRGKSRPSNASGLGAFLRVDQLEFVAADQLQRRACLRADADPVQARRGVLGAVGLDRHLEPGGVQRLDRSLVELQQRFAAGAHHERPGTRVRLAVPRGGDRGGQVPRRSRTGPRPARRCRRNRCRRTGRPRGRGLSPGRSTGCNW